MTIGDGLFMLAAMIGLGFIVGAIRIDISWPKKQ